MHSPSGQMPCLMKRQHSFSQVQGTFPQFKGWLHHLCSSPSTPATFQRRRLPCIGNLLWGDLHAMVQVHINSVIFLSVSSLSTHMVCGLSPATCRSGGHCKQCSMILNDAWHQGKYNRVGFIPAVVICPHCLTVCPHCPAQELSDLLLISIRALITHTFPSLVLSLKILGI